MTRVRIMRRLLPALVLAAVAAAMGGCGTVGVRPWDRDVLARPGMTPGDDVITSSLDEHIYFSKEASTGGLGSGGGGCGCN